MSAAGYPGPAVVRVAALLRRLLDPEAPLEAREGAAAEFARFGAAALMKMREDPAFGGLLLALEGLTAVDRADSDGEVGSDDDPPRGRYTLGSDLRVVINESYRTEQVLLPGAAALAGRSLTVRARLCALAGTTEAYDAATARSMAATCLDRISAYVLLFDRAPQQPVVWRAYLDAVLAPGAASLPLSQPLARAVVDATALRPETATWIDGLAEWIEACLDAALLHPAAPPATHADWGTLHLALRGGAAWRARVAGVVQPRVLAFAELLVTAALIGAASRLDLREAYLAVSRDPAALHAYLRTPGDESGKHLEMALGDVLRAPTGGELARLPRAERESLVWAARVIAHDPQLRTSGLLTD